MDKIPPQNLDAELCLIGCVLVDADCLPEVLSRVEPADFHDMRCEAIFRAMIDLDERNVRIDKIALTGYLREKNYLDRIGGMDFFKQAVEVIPSVASVAYYAKIVAEKAHLRRIITAGSEIMRIGFECEIDPDRALPEAVDALAACEISKDSGAHLSPRERLKLAYERALFPQSQTCVSSPWKELDAKIGGFYPGQLIVWAGAPKAGKSAAALTMADHIAQQHGQVIYFAIEMDEQEVTERQLAMHSGVSVQRQRSGSLSPREEVMLAQSFEQCEHVPLEVVRQKIRSIGAMRRLCRKFERNGPIKAIIVDHVGKLTEVLTSSARENKVERLDRVYNSLIDLAREFSCALHAIQHINRAGQANGRPTLIDIRDGGNPEGHANAVLLVYRPDPMGLDNRAHEGEIIIAASRNGEAGVVPMIYEGVRGLWKEKTPFASMPIPAEWYK